MTAALRVVQVVDTLALGGAERIVAMLAEGLTRRGVDVRVVALRSLSGDTLRAPLERFGVPVVSLGARGFYDVGAWLKLVRYLRQESIDVVHTHLVYADVLGRTAAAAAGVPVVSTLHNVPDGFAEHRVDRLRLERMTARWLARRVICVSQRALEGFQLDWGIPPRRLALVPNAIDLAPWLAVPEGVRRGGSDPNGLERDASSASTAILSVGRLNPQKAFDVLMRAARVVVDVCPDVHFTILGRGERAAELERLRDELGLRDAVTFAGQQEDVPSWFERADLFVSSSAWEGMPLVVIEAMAAARPVVVTDVGGSREVVGDDGCGVVVPPSDPDALARAILTLVNDPERRRSMGAAARARARAAFDIEGLIDAHQAIYREVTSPMHAPGRTPEATAP